MPGKRDCHEDSYRDEVEELEVSGLSHYKDGLEAIGLNAEDAESFGRCFMKGRFPWYVVEELAGGWSDRKRQMITRRDISRDSLPDRMISHGLNNHGIPVQRVWKNLREHCDEYNMGMDKLGSYSLSEGIALILQKYAKRARSVE